MSINNAMNRNQRQQEAAAAGRILYNSVNENNSSTQPNGVLRDLEEPDACQSVCGGRRNISAVRRTFCLLTLFDLILSFILWVIYTQLMAGTISETFKTEVEEYNFGLSLFDTVVLSFWRFAVLIVSYAIIISEKPWMVAVTTFGTCAFLLVKVFLFKFSDNDGTSGDGAIKYLILLVSFVMAWVETWMLDFKVLRRERRDRRQAAMATVTERTPLLVDRGHYNYPPADHYYSPVDTPNDSDTEDIPSDSFHSVPGTRSHSRTGSVCLSLGSQEQEYIKSGKEAMDTALLYVNQEDDWKLETHKEDINASVYSKFVPKIGKLFKLKAFLNASAKEVWEDMWLHGSKSPQWNPTVLEVRTLQCIDDHTEVAYTIANEAAGGMVSARDFVTVRCWEYHDGSYIQATYGTTHPDMPEQKKYVRGDNGAGCMISKPIENEMDRCEFIWLLNTNLKGWLPQYLIDQSLSGVMIDFTKAFQEHLANSTQNSEQFLSIEA